MLTLARNVAGIFLAHWLVLAGGLLPSLGAAASATKNGILSGRVCDQAQVPLPGVVVMLKGQGAATTTNAAGSFVLSCAEDAPVLVLTCAGYQTQTLPVDGRKPLDIIMYRIGAGTAGPVASEPAAAPEEAPAFPGGAAAYHAYLKQHFRYPAAAQQQHTTCSVLVSFVVDEMGRILDAEVGKSCGAGLDEEALRLVRLMPWWTPARAQGKAVRATTSLRIRFELQ